MNNLFVVYIIGAMDRSFMSKFWITCLFGYITFTENSDHGIKIWLYWNSQSKFSFFISLFVLNKAFFFSCPVFWVLSIYIYIYMIVYQWTVTQSSIETSIKTCGGSLHTIKTIWTNQIWSSTSNISYVFFRIKIITRDWILMQVQRCYKEEKLYH